MNKCKIQETESRNFLRYLDSLVDSDLIIEGPVIPDKRYGGASKVWLVKIGDEKIGEYSYCYTRGGGPALPEKSFWYEGIVPKFKGKVNLGYTETATHANRCDNFPEIPFP